MEGFAVEGNGIVDAGGFVADFDFALVAVQVVDMKY